MLKSLKYKSSKPIVMNSDLVLRYIRPYIFISPWLFLKIVINFTMFYHFNAQF